MTSARFTTRSSEPALQAPAAAPLANGSVHVVTFGCQMNKYDSLVVEGRFRQRGWRLVEHMADADVVLFNTCSVRDHAEERTYSWLGELRELKRVKPELVIGVLGCMAQRAEEEIFGRATHVDIVCGTRRFQFLPEMVEELRARRADPELRARGQARVLDVAQDGAVSVSRTGEAYAGGLCGYLTVMRGCDLNCTYCIVPKVRGRVASRPVEEILAEARWMVEQGAKAITLLGQTVNSYGEDLPEPESGSKRGLGRRGRPALADLLYRLEELPGLERVRLITLHPSYVTRELARALRECSKAERFLPLPAQSGSDRILRAMKRGYTRELYLERIALLRDEVPDLELGSDWIVGFPTETRADFEASLSLLAEVGYSQGYVFQYDPRPETAAHERLDDVPREEKKARNQELLAALERSARRRLETQLGRPQEVLVEELVARPRQDGTWLRGRSRHNSVVGFRGEPALLGSTLCVQPSEASAYALLGEILPAS